MDQKTLGNGVKRPDPFSMSDYALNDVQERLYKAMKEDLDSADNPLAVQIRLQYWTKRIWEDSVENYKMSKRLL